MASSDSTLKNFFTDNRRSMTVIEGGVLRPLWMRPKDRYARLRAMYSNNDLYLGNPLIEALMGQRTPVNRSVEFFVAKVFPTEHMQVKAPEAIANAIAQIEKWSNFAGNKSAWLRDFALLGDLFIRVQTDEEKVWEETIDPATVTDFEVDSRGFVQWLRIDQELGGGHFYTEYWTKESFETWVHQHGANADLSLLGTPTTSGLTAELGIDFVPIVWAPFRRLGRGRGAGAVDHAVDKIDEANKKATRLSQMLFRYNKALWVATAGGMTPGGIPLAPALGQEDLEKELADGNDVISLSGAGNIAPLVPAINYQGALAIVQSDVDEIEKDLPELKYYSLQDKGASGKALITLLGGALDRAKEARLNFSQALQRANEIAMTMGQFTGVLENLGTFESGALEHSFDIDDIFSDDIADKATVFAQLTGEKFGLDEAARLAGIVPTVGGVTKRVVTLQVDVGPQPVPTQAGNQPAA